MVVLRDYQSAAANLACDALASHGATLVVMATGMGKTVVFGEVIRRYVERGLATLMCVHREELVMQGAARILADTGMEPAIEMADAYSPEDGFRPPMCVVSSVQSLSRPGRLARFPRGRFGLVVIDEAHHVAAASFGAILDHFAPAHHLGVTATPRRGDGAALGPRMKSLACEYGIEWGVANGWLVPVKQLIVKVDGLDFARVKVTSGDWSAGELDEILSAEGPLHAIARPVAEEAGREQVIVFCAGVKQAAALSAVLNRYRPAFSRWLCGDVKKTHPDDRKAMVADFKSGTLQCLVNVGVLTEGFDHGPTGLVVVARPTRSLGLYCLDSRTEILTRSGWMGRGYVKAGDEVATWKDGAVRWSPVRQYIDRAVLPDELMVSYESPALSIRVTQNHRLVYSKRRGRDRSWSPWAVAEAGDVAAMKGCHRFPVSGVEDAPGVPLTDDELRFIGWFLTDGSVSRHNGQVTIFQDVRQEANIAAIRSCLIGCGFKFGTHVVTRKTNFSASSTIIRFTVSHGSPRGRDKDKRGWAGIEAYIDKSLSPLLDPLTAGQLATLLEAIHLGDGQKQPQGADWVQRSYHIGTGNKVFAERLQSLCVRRGWRCNLSTDLRSLKGTGNDFYYLRIKKAGDAFIGGANAEDRPTLRFSAPDALERVWCVETEDGTIITRRDGKVCVMGNCQMLGRATRPLKGVVDGPPDAASRHAAIRASAKPSCRILDFVGASSRHSLKQVTAADALGGDIDPKVKVHARQNMESAPLPGADVAREIERARAEMVLLAEEEERRRRITAEVEYRLEDGGGAGHAISNVGTPMGVIVEPATPGQVWKLRSLGFDHEKAKRLSKKQAIGVIGRLMLERAMNGRAA